MTRILIGVDGGGSRTRALAADDRRAIRVGARGGARECAIRPDEPSHGRPGSSRGSCTDALRAAGHEEDARVGVVCVGESLAPGATPSAGRSGEALSDMLAGRRDHRRARTPRSDSRMRSRAGPGVLLLAGTGSVAYGRGPTGSIGRCGGWGPAMGDEGGGAWIGRRALGGVTAATDGREPETALTGAILTAAEVGQTEDLIAWAAAATPATVASLAPVVLRCAESGDRRAATIVSFAAEELVLHVRALAQRLFGDERAAVPVGAFTGGLLRRGIATSHLARAPSQVSGTGRNS